MCGVELSKIVNPFTFFKSPKSIFINSQYHSDLLVGNAIPDPNSKVWWMDEQTDGWGIDGPINELADRWMDEQMEGWISGWVNGWMDRHFYTWLSVCIPLMSKADFFFFSPWICACVSVCMSIYCIGNHSCFVYVCLRACLCVKQLCFADRLSGRYSICHRQQDDIYSVGQMWFLVRPFSYYGFQFGPPHAGTYVASGPDQMHVGYVVQAFFSFFSAEQKTEEVHWSIINLYFMPRVFQYVNQSVDVFTHCYCFMTILKTCV